MLRAAAFSLFYNVPAFRFLSDVDEFFIFPGDGRKLKQKELAAAQARDGELDGLFERIYEDNISGKLSDERFAKMSQRYEEEQAELSEKIKALRKELDKLSGDSVSTDMFLTTVRKYTRA